jgi:hypothetical protein
MKAKQAGNISLEPGGGAVSLTIHDWAAFRPLQRTAHLGSYDLTA